MNKIRVLFNLFFVLFLNPFFGSSFAADTAVIDKQIQAIGVYSGLVEFKKKESLEYSLWFEDKGEIMPDVRLGGFMTVGDRSCVFSLRNGRILSNQNRQAYIDKAKGVFKTSDNLLVLLVDINLIGQQKPCTRLGMHKYYNGVFLQLALVGNAKQGFQIQLRSRHENRRIKEKEYSGLVQRSAPSALMQSYIKSYDKYDLGKPSEAEILALNTPSQALIPEKLRPVSCTRNYNEISTLLQSIDVEDIASYDLNGDKYLRFKRFSMNLYTESKLTAAESASLSAEQWEFFNYHFDSYVIGENACNQAKILGSDAVLSLIKKYVKKSEPAIDGKYFITKRKTIFIVEPGRLDYIPPKRDYNQAIRKLGQPDLFSPNEETRLFNWKNETQKAYQMPKYKNSKTGEVFSDKDEFVEAFFVPSEAVSARLNASVLTLLTRGKGSDQVCPKWSGSPGNYTCLGYEESLKADQIFITHNEQAAITLYKELTADGNELAINEGQKAFSDTCLTKEFCNFPAASFITAIYNNNYGNFVGQNKKYSAALVERYKDHITVTNALLDAMGVQRSNKQQLNLFPFFAEHYLHKFDEKYPNCKRTTTKLSIRSDTKAYSIVDGFGNEVQSVDSVALYSDYQIPTVMTQMCNEICGQTGPSRALSNASNLLFHPNMIKILDGLEQTMDTFTCNSPEIMTLERGMLSIYSKMKSSHKQDAYIERSTLL